MIWVSSDSSHSLVSTFKEMIASKPLKPHILGPDSRDGMKCTRMKYNQYCPMSSIVKGTKQFPLQPLLRKTKTPRIHSRRERTTAMQECCCQVCPSLSPGVNMWRILRLVGKHMNVCGDAALQLFRVTAGSFLLILNFILNFNPTKQSPSTF